MFTICLKFQLAKTSALFIVAKAICSTSHNKKAETNTPGFRFKIYRTNTGKTLEENLQQLSLN